MVLLLSSFAAYAADLPGSTLNSAEAQTGVTVTAATYNAVIDVTTAIRPDGEMEALFGFNNQAWGMQNETLYDDDASPKLRATVDTALDSFSGGILRYPGGLNAQNFVWEEAVGTVASRGDQKQFDYDTTYKVEYGVQEWCDVKNAHNLQGVYVANLLGRAYADTPNARDDDTDFTAIAVSGRLNEEPLDDVVASATAWAQWTIDNDCWRTGEVPYIQLGNELDRSNYEYSPEWIATRAKALITALNALTWDDETPQYIAFGRHYDWTFDDAESQGDTWGSWGYDGDTDTNGQVANRLYRNTNIVTAAGNNADGGNSDLGFTAQYGMTSTITNAHICATNTSGSAANAKFVLWEDVDADGDITDDGVVVAQSGNINIPDGTSAVTTFSHTFNYPAVQGRRYEVTFWTDSAGANLKFCRDESTGNAYQHYNWDGVAAIPEPFSVNATTSNQAWELYLEVSSISEWEELARVLMDNCVYCADADHYTLHRYVTPYADVEGLVQTAPTSTTLTIETHGTVGSSNAPPNDSDDDGYYNTYEIEIVGGTGSGQIKTVNAYTESTDTITVNSAFSPTLDGTSSYVIRVKNATDDQTIPGHYDTIDYPAIISTEIQQYKPNARLVQTEHARVYNFNLGLNNQDLRLPLNNAYSSVVNADQLISITNMPEYLLASYHAMQSEAWQLFDRNIDGGANNFAATAVMEGMLVQRALIDEVSIPIKTVTTTDEDIIVHGRSVNDIDGWEMRAQAFRNLVGNKFGAWIVNYKNTAQDFTITIAQVANQTWTLKHSYIQGETGQDLDPQAADAWGWTTEKNPPAVQKTFNGSGSLTISVPPMSVNSLLFSNDIKIVPVGDEYGDSFVQAADLNIVVNVPTGTASGDSMLGVVGTASTGVNPNIVTPAGWTLLANREEFATGSDREIAIFCKVATGSEPTNYTFQNDAQGTNNWGGARIITVRGADDCNLDVPYVQVNHSSTTFNDTIINAPDITTSANNAMVLTTFYGTHNEITNFGAPSLYDLRHSATEVGNFRNVAVASREIAVGGTIETIGDWTNIPDQQVAADLVAITISIPPKITPVLPSLGTVRFSITESFPQAIQDSVN